MGHVFPRNSKAPPIKAGRGQGVYLFDESGKAYLNCGDAAVSCLGHSDEHVTNAVKKQMDQMAFAHTGFFTSDPAEKLAEKLVTLAPQGLDRVYFVSGGSEAMEAALKLARQYFVEIDQPDRRHIIARKQSYHGNTLGALATGGNVWRRERFAPLLIDVSHVAPCYAYRGKKAAESEADFLAGLIAEIEAEIERLGPENVMAFVAEPVVGATLGAVPAVEGYFARVREVCDRHGILLILDEVMCGMGRTDTMFAFEQENICPDICVVAKGLGAGYQPIGAMLCSAQIYSVIRDGSGYFQHGHTYVGHPVACAAGLAVLERLTDDGVMARVPTLGETLRRELDSAFGQHPNIGDIRGRGLFQGIEFVADRETKQPFAAGQKVHSKLKSAAFEAGLICYPMGGTVDGVDGDHVLLAPPFIVDEGQIDELVGKLGKAIGTVLNSE